MAKEEQIARENTEAERVKAEKIKSLVQQKQDFNLRELEEKKEDPEELFEFS
mgnify:CR=1 FL=1